MLDVIQKMGGGGVEYQLGWLEWSLANKAVSIQVWEGEKFFSPEGPLASQIVEVGAGETK